MDTARTIGGRLRTRMLAIPFAILAAGLPRASAGDDILGDWEVKMDRDGRVSYASLSVSKKADGTLAGKWGANDLSDVKFDSGKLTFVRTIRFGDRQFDLKYEGTLKDGILTGALSSDQGSFDANATRPKPKSPVLGRWQLAYAIGDREIEATLAISEGTGGSLDAKWTTATGEHVVSNVKFQEGKLTLARKTKIEDREFESTYEATVKGNKLTGTIKREQGESPANGTRVGADLVGKWELTTTTDQGTRTSMLTVFGDLTGRYESFGGEIPFKDLKLDGNQVAFAIETGFGDQTFTIDFKGKLDGKNLKGEVTSPRGTREVTGKRIESAPAVSAAVGTWEITREGSQGTRIVKLTIKPDMTGTYTTGENSVGITDLRVEGDQISFKATVTRGGQEVPMEFKGNVEGSTLKGQFTTPRGTREATGKKVGS